MSLVKFKSNLPNAALEPGTPLWQVVPTRGADGRPLADFMMLIPGLRQRPQHEINITLANIQKALESCEDVVFVNMNLKINVLWVSVNARPGITLKLISAIQNLVPEALMVSHL